jgi:hypothetical protein
MAVNSIANGEAAIVNRRRAFDDWITIGEAFHESESDTQR